MSQLSIYLIIHWSLVFMVHGNGLMLLYRPRDISKDCALSRYLRYDLTFGMGMSDTITLVFRTLFDIDYKCVVDIVAETHLTTLIIVVRYPDAMTATCEVDKEAITVLKKDRCFRLCDYVKDDDEKDVGSMRTIFPVKGRLRFRFLSNSSINIDMNAPFYQITATAARLRPGSACYIRNETNCNIKDKQYCFTSGVVCDGIQNCGVDDWFDERKALCSLPIEKLGYAPVIAVAAALLCSVLAVSHLLLRGLPPQATSFFIFNANEDNRLCIDPVLKPRGSCSQLPEKLRDDSLVPVSSSSSADDEIIDKQTDGTMGETFKAPKPIMVVPSRDYEVQPARRKITLRSMTAKIQETLRLVSGSRNYSTNLPLEMSTMESKTEDV